MGGLYPITSIVVGEKKILEGGGGEEEQCSSALRVMIEEKRGSQMGMTKVLVAQQW